MVRFRSPLVVALPDGDDEALLRYAAWEALHHGCGVHLVHAHAGDDPARAQRVLTSAVARTEVVAGPGVPVTGAAVVGPPVASALRRATDAVGIAVRQRDFLHLMRALEDGGDVPIACVPSGWTPVPEDGRPVLVGVADPDVAAGPIGRAVGVARAHRTSLRVLHAWHFPRPHDEVIEARMGDQWSASLREGLAEALARCHHPSDDVSVEVVVAHGLPAEILLDAARRAQVLVLERRPASHGRAHVGRTTRAALHECPCPIVLLPPAPDGAGTNVPAGRDRGL